MNGIRSSFAANRYVIGENDYVVGTIKTSLHEESRGIVFVHGSGQVAVDINPSAFLYSSMASVSSLHIGDLGGQTWGNDTVVTRIGQALDLLENTYGCERFALCGASMGGLNALNYIVRHSDRLQCAALLIPATSLQSLRSNPYLASRWSEIDAIYGAPPSADYTGHSPIDFVNDIDPAFPMKIWWSTDDPLVYPSTITDFLVARPQTESQSMGPVSHDVPDEYILPMRYWLDKNMPA